MSTDEEEEPTKVQVAVGAVLVYILCALGAVCGISASIDNFPKVFYFSGARLTVLILVLVFGGIGTIGACVVVVGMTIMGLKFLLRHLKGRNGVR